MIYLQMWPKWTSSGARSIWVEWCTTIREKLCRAYPTLAARATFAKQTRDIREKRCDVARTSTHMHQRMLLLTTSLFIYFPQIEHGADPWLRDVSDITPLIIAASVGNTEVINILLDSGKFD
jgi:hypothetical protein